jgi:hypothetical protein
LNEGTVEGREPSAFAGPVHVAFGAADGLVTPEIAGNIAKRFALSSIEAVPGCGHWPHAEHPELVAAILARFLGSLKNKKTTETRGGADSWAVGFDEHSDQAFGLALHPAVVFEASVLSRVMQGCERAQTILGALPAGFMRRWNSPAASRTATAPIWNGKRGLAAANALLASRSLRLTRPARSPTSRYITVHCRACCAFRRNSIVLSRDKSSQISSIPCREARPTTELQMSKGFEVMPTIAKRTVPIEHVKIQSAKSFMDVRAGLERTVPQLDLSVLELLANGESSE